MSKIDNGGPAFPGAKWFGERGVSEGGMTLRDWFAGQVKPPEEIALAWAVIYAGRQAPEGDGEAAPSEEHIAFWMAVDAGYRYRQADAMLAARGTTLNVDAIVEAARQARWVYEHGGDVYTAMVDLGRVLAAKAPIEAEKPAYPVDAIAALLAVVPYAESRAEDMDEAAVVSGGEDDRLYADGARHAVDWARMVLAEAGAIDQEPRPDPVPEMLRALRMALPRLPLPLDADDRSEGAVIRRAVEAAIAAGEGRS